MFPHLRNVFGVCYICGVTRIPVITTLRNVNRKDTMQSLTLNFTSVKALAAAMPVISTLEGLVRHNEELTTIASLLAPGNAAPAQTAPSSPTAGAATVVAQDQKPTTSTQSAAQYTFKQVSDALAAYHTADKDAFGAAMKKFGFKSMSDVEAARDKWGELMSYIDADPGYIEGAVPAKTYTIDEVKAKLMAFAKKDEGAFGSLMKDKSLTGFKDVEAKPELWAELVAAAEKAGV